MQSEQEPFWPGDFGNAYVDRNASHSKIYCFSKILLDNRISLDTAELGANIGINLDALVALYLNITTYGVETNANSHSILLSKHQAHLGSVSQSEAANSYGLVFCAGVPIHQFPNLLPAFYDKLCSLSHNYTLIAEFNSPTPVELEYRGFKGQLFERDFGRCLWARYPNLKLVDYGFVWGMDSLSVGEDLNCLIFEKA